MTKDDALTRVHDALIGLAEALETAQPDRVLAVEQPLADAVSALVAVDRASHHDPVSLRARLLETRLALERCRGLGEASGDLIRTMWPGTSSYTRGGARAGQPSAPPTVTTRV